MAPRWAWIAAGRRPHFWPLGLACAHGKSVNFVEIVGDGEKPTPFATAK